MNKGLRRVAAVAVAALVVAPALATAASANSTFTFDRLAGVDRYATSVAVATQYGTSASVILANGASRAFPDALTASYLAGFKSAPIMLTKKDSTPSNVLARIVASGAKDIYLVGDTGVISAAQEASLDVLYTVHRLGGLDRYLTAEKVIAEAGKAKSTTAVLATGVNFPDAIAGGPLSYVKGMPLAITLANRLPDATLRALKAAGTTNVIALGGPTVVSQAVLDTLAANGITLNKRIFGDNRSETSSKLAEYLVTSEGFTKTGVNVASGYAFGGGADALAGGPLSGKEVRPTLITENVTNVGPGPIGYLKANCATLANGHIFGDKGAVSASAEAEMQAAARCATSNQTYTVTPSTDAVVTPVTGSRTYTVSGLTVGDAVQIVLVTPASVEGGVFALDATQRIAQVSTPATGLIDQINGVPLTTPAVFKTFTAVASSFTFRVKGSAAVSLVPVVFNNNDADGNIEVNLAGVATEAVGIGGMVTFAGATATAPAEAADTNVVSADAPVTALWSTGFVINGGTATGKLLAYHADDVYQLNGGVITKAQFLSILSVTDTIGAIASYSQAGLNTYNITADNVATSGGLVATATASATTLGKVTVTYDTGLNASPNGTVFTLQRRQLVSSGGAPVAGSAGVYATVKTGTVAALGVQTFTETLTAGFYEYQVQAVSPAFSGTATVTSTAGNGRVTVTTTSSLVAPALRRLFLTSNASNINSLSSGDVFKVVVTTPLTTPVLGATLTIGTKVITYTAATATAQGSATFTVNSAAEVVDGASLPAGTVLTVTMLADPDTGPQAFGSGLAFTAASGIGNTAGALTGLGGANDLLTKDVVL